MRSLGWRFPIVARAFQVHATYPCRTTNFRARLAQSRCSATRCPKPPPKTVVKSLTKVPADRFAQAGELVGETRRRRRIWNAARSLRMRPTVIHPIGKQTGCSSAVIWPVGGTIALIPVASNTSSATDERIAVNADFGKRSKISPFYQQNSDAPWTIHGSIRDLQRLASWSMGHGYRTSGRLQCVREVSALAHTTVLMRRRTKLRGYPHKDSQCAPAFSE